MRWSKATVNDAKLSQRTLEALLTYCHLSLSYLKPAFTDPVIVVHLIHAHTQKKKKKLGLVSSPNTYRSG